MGRIFNIKAIFVTFTVSLRVGVESCEGEVYIGPFESKDSARPWIQEFKLKLVEYWNRRYFVRPEQNSPDPPLMEELEDNFRHGTEITLQVKSQRIGGVKRSRVKAASRFALDQKSLSMDELVRVVPSSLVQNVSFHLLELFR